MLSKLKHPPKLPAQRQTKRQKQTGKHKVDSDKIGQLTVQIISASQVLWRRD